MPEFFEKITTLLSVGGGRRVGKVLVLNDTFTDTVLRKLKWEFNGDPGYARHVRSIGSGANRVRIRTYLHRMVFEHYKGAIPDGKEVDHVDRNPLNALPENLRLLSHSLNVRNQSHSPNNTSGYRGVCWVVKTRKWRAYIKKDGRQIYLGVFLSPKSAARAVNAAHRNFFPEVAIPNPEVE